MRSPSKPFASFDDKPVAGVHRPGAPCRHAGGQGCRGQDPAAGGRSSFARELDLLAWMAEVERTAPWTHRFRMIEAVRLRRFRRHGAGPGHGGRRGIRAGRELSGRRPVLGTGSRLASDDRRVLTTVAWVEGVRPDDDAGLEAFGLDPTEILRRVRACIFFNQVFRDGFFHADMHPGGPLISGSWDA